MTAAPPAADAFRALAAAVIVQAVRDLESAKPDRKRTAHGLLFSGAPDFTALRRHWLELIAPKRVDDLERILIEKGPEGILLALNSGKL